MFRLLKSKKGITLIELITSIAILCIIAIPLNTMFVNIARTNSKTNVRMLSNQLAQEYMEKIKGITDFSGIIGTTDNYETRNGKDFTVRVTVAVGASDYEREIGSAPPSADADIGDASGIMADTNIRAVNYNIYSVDADGDSTDVGDYTSEQSNIIVYVTYGAENLSLNVDNSSGKPMDIYVRKASESLTTNINVNTYFGQVNVYRNVVFENPVYTNWIYSITIEVYNTQNPGELTNVNRLVVLQSSKIVE